MAKWAEQYQQGLNLSTGPLVVPILFSLPECDYLLVVAHHLVMDSVSWRILLDDMNSLYRQWNEGLTPVLPSKTNSFRDWAVALAEYARSEKLEKEKTYWQRVSAECAAIATNATNNRIGDFKISNFSVSKEITRLLTSDANTAYGTETGELLMAAFALAMQKTSGCNRIAVSMEGHGREQIAEDLNINRTVGWFTSLFPLLLPVSEDLHLHIISVKETIRNIPEKGIGYGIFQYLSPWGNPQTRLPAVSFNFLGSFDGMASDDLLEVTGGEGQNFSPERNWEFELSVSAHIKSEQLNITIAYNAKRYDSAEIDGLGRSLAESLESIVHFCTAQEKQNLTPSDITLQDISLSELELLTKRLE
jgi:non-ribosomal peptide synthase protein (TIGR01720 family)